MVASVDYTGAALLVTAISGLTTVAMQVVTVLSGQARDRKLTELHTLVDGQQSKLNEVVQTAVAGQARAEGHIEGVANERAHQEPS
jgi:hypothetical protein